MNNAGQLSQDQTQRFANLGANLPYPNSTLPPDQLKNFDHQLGFVKYFEARMYNFRSPRSNPFLPILNINGNYDMMPHAKFSRPENDVCVCCVAKARNIIDKKAVNCLTFVPYTNKVIYGTSNGKLNLCNLNDNNTSCLNEEMKNTIAFRAIRFARDDAVLLTGDKKGNVTYFAYNKLNSSLDFKSFVKLHHGTVTDIAFSVTARKFVTSSDDKKLNVVDFGSGLSDLVFDEHLSDVKSCDWNPHRNLIVSGGKDQKINLWDPGSGANHATLDIHKDTINRLRFSPNGNWLLSGSKDSNVKVTDIRMMRELQVFKGHSKEVNTLCWHPVHEELCCSAGVDGRIIHWKVGQEKSYVVEQAHDKEIYDISYNKLGTLLVSGSNDSFLKFWVKEAVKSCEDK